MTIVEASPEIEKVSTLNALQHEHGAWLLIKARVERSGGLDGLINKQWGWQNDRMNLLLENLFLLTSMELECEDGS